MTIQELRAKTGLSQLKFAEYFGLPIRTVQEWEQGRRKPPDYIPKLLEKAERIREMDKMYQFMLDRLNQKKQELAERQGQFEVMWHNEKHSGCFERNAINDLLIMQQLKSKIKELEHWETMIKVQKEK